jgi:hypothetical protein
MGLLNDVWKASVLLRLGYTVRNTAEATMSILAKGYGLVAAADLSKEGFEKWYQNRVIGFERLTDKNLVKKGVREDSVELRNEMTRTQAERAQLQSLNQEIDSQMEAVELAFKRGKLTEQQALEFLEISSYRTGEILHHGSPVGLTSINPNRPLAMTYSDDIANRYAEAGMKIISAARIQERLTGRAGRLPRNIEQSPAAPMGSVGVTEQMSREEFNNVILYAIGYNEISMTQARLRGLEFDVYLNRIGLNPDQAKFVKDFKRTITRSVVPKNTTVYRATDNPMYADAEIGQIIDEPAFVSTSKSKKITYERSRNVTMEIKLPKGHPGLDVEDAYARFGATEKT